MIIPDILNKYAESVRKAIATPQQTAVPKVPIKDYAAGLIRPDLTAIPEDQQFKASYNPASALLVALGLSQQRENNIKAENQKASLQEYGMKLKNAQELNQKQELNRMEKKDPAYIKAQAWLDRQHQMAEEKFPLEMDYLKARTAKTERTGSGSGGGKSAKYTRYVNDDGSVTFVNQSDPTDVKRTAPGVVDKKSLVKVFNPETGDYVFYTKDGKPTGMLAGKEDPLETKIRNAKKNSQGQTTPATTAPKVQPGQTFTSKKDGKKYKLEMDGVTVSEVK